MTIALFPDPFRVSVDADMGSISGHGMLIGMETGNGLQGIIFVEDGRIVRVPVANFTIDWKYIPEADRWTDLELAGRVEVDQG